MAKKKPVDGSPRRNTMGVPTTTPIAFSVGQEVYLERMNVLSEEGAGVLADVTVDIGTRVSIAFHLSTAKAAVRCKAEVVGALPTTPAGMKLKEKLGDRAMPAILSAGMSDSATAMFRMEDLEALKEARAAKPDKQRQLAAGFSLKFVDLDQTGQEAVRHHIETSQRLAEQLTASGGQMLALGSDDRRIGDLFDDGDLSKRALDW